MTSDGDFAPVVGSCTAYAPCCTLLGVHFLLSGEHAGDGTADELLKPVSAGAGYDDKDEVRPSPVGDARRTWPMPVRGSGRVPFALLAHLASEGPRAHSATWLHAICYLLHGVRMVWRHGAQGELAESIALGVHARIDQQALPIRAYAHGTTRNVQR